MRDAADRVVDFHALRMTFITLIVKGGASAKVAQHLARHSDPNLTLNTYTSLGLHDVVAGLDGLPATPSADGGDSEPATLAAIGTDDAKPQQCVRVQVVVAADGSRPLSLRRALHC